MEVNAIFADVKVYSVQNRLDVVQGQEFTLEYTGETPADIQVFTSNDPVLSVDGDGLHMVATSLGESKLRFMSGTGVVKDILIVVVDATHPNATALNGGLGEPVNK